MMRQANGIVEKVDEFGRLRIPAELRSALGIGEDDTIELFEDGERIALMKRVPGCTFCGSEQAEYAHRDKPICHPCIAELQGWTG